MDFNLERALRRDPRMKRSRVEMDMPILPRTFEKELAQIYLKVVNLWTRGVVEDLVQSYQEVLVVDSPSTVLRSLDNRTVQALLTFAQDYGAWKDRVAQAHFRQLIRRLRYATNLDLSSVLSQGLPQETFEALLDWNVGLIRNVTEDARNRVSSAVYSGLTARTPPREVAKEIREAIGISRRRAERIASDQMVKMTSALDGQRLLDLGMEGYGWEHSRKAHPRKEHQARQGDYIKFGSEIDRTDPPGYAPFCGCKRRMVLNLED